MTFYLICVYVGSFVSPYIFALLAIATCWYHVL